MKSLKSPRRIRRYVWHYDISHEACTSVRSIRSSSSKALIRQILRKHRGSSVGRDDFIAENERRESISAKSKFTMNVFVDASTGIVYVPYQPQIVAAARNLGYGLPSS
jgi:hypothetical protein